MLKRMLLPPQSPHGRIVSLKITRLNDRTGDEDGRKLSPEVEFGIPIRKSDGSRKLEMATDGRRSVRLVFRPLYTVLPTWKWIAYFDFKAKWKGKCIESGYRFDIKFPSAL